MNQTNYFLKTLEHLRSYEEILLFTNLHPITEGDQNEVVNFLENEYNNEAVTYPFSAPPFDREAALWSAKTLYLSSQLLLYREHREADLPLLFPAYQNEMTASAVLSADLVLRFLPDVLQQLKSIDPDDGLLPLLEVRLSDWHYSGIQYPLAVENLDFALLATSACLRQLYVDRVIATQNLAIAHHPVVKPAVVMALGLYAPQLWSRFHQEIEIEHETH